MFAACMPAQDDWLNDLSSTPPVSRTMHAVSAPPPPLDEVLAGPELAGAELDVSELDVAGAGGGVEPELPPPLLLEPQAERASATTATPEITALERRARTLVVPFDDRRPLCRRCVSRHRLHHGPPRKSQPGAESPVRHLIVARIVAAVRIVAELDHCLL